MSIPVRLSSVLHSSNSSSPSFTLRLIDEQQEPNCSFRTSSCKCLLSTSLSSQSDPLRALVTMSIPGDLLVPPTFHFGHNISDFRAVEKCSAIISPISPTVSVLSPRRNCDPVASPPD